MNRTAYYGNGWSLSIAVDGTKIMAPGNRYENFYEVYTTENHTFYVRNSKEVSTNATNTNAKTIKIIAALYTDANGGQLWINDSGSYTSTMKVQEIAQ